MIVTVELLVDDDELPGYFLRPPWSRTKRGLFLSVGSSNRMQSHSHPIITHFHLEDKPMT